MVLLGVADEIIAHLWTVRWSPALSVFGHYWGQTFLQGGHRKDLGPVEMVILGHHQKTPVS